MDFLSPDERSERMRSIRSSGTKPEEMVRDALLKCGYRPRSPRKKVSGRPDFVFLKRKAAIFVHGCFWHHHSCQMGRIPGTREEFWRAKFALNRLRDSRVQRILRKAGFRLAEHPTNYAARLKRQLSTDYKVYEKLLDLTQFGVPQGRTRYFVIAIRSDLYAEDPFEHLLRSLPSYLRKLGLSSPVSSSSALSDLEIARCGRRNSRDTVGFDEIAYDKPLTKYQKLMNAGCHEPSDLRLARHSPEITERFQQIIAASHEEGRLNTVISSATRERFGLKKQALRVLDPDAPSPTITSMPDDLLHYREPRTLTVRENARLQSFPDWYSFKGKYTTGGHLRRKEVPRFTQVANAVPPLVARALGETLAAIFADMTKASAPVARVSRLELICKQAKVRA